MISSAVLAGGRSQRMGRDKALLPGPAGDSWLATTLDKLALAGLSPALVSLADPPLAGQLEAARAAGARPVRDRRARQGPLAGLEAVLLETPSEWTVVVAVDLPELPVSLLSRLRSRAQSAPDSVDVIAAAQLDGQPEPLCAAYRRRCLAPAQAALERGQRAMWRLLAELQVELVALEAGESLRNVNAPEDL